VIALAYGLFARLAARVLRPVRDVATTARGISRGRRDQRLVARENDDELQEMVAAFNDMLDALADALERSQDAEQVSRRFLADAAHQLRTPAAGIRASVGTMMRTEEGAEREQLLDNLAAESARMSRLLSSLLRVARLDSREAPSLTATRLAPMVDELVAHQRVRAPRLRFEVDGADDVVAEVDRESLGEAVANLLDNAARHAHQLVQVEVASDEEGTVIRIRDDGPGVAPDLRERIFDRFVSLDGGPGSGLGLPIARGIAEAHGGSLHHDGSAFVLRLPRVADSLRVT
jgi:signal transduction histidine kinase